MRNFPYSTYPLLLALTAYLACIPAYGSEKSHNVEVIIVTSDRLPERLETIPLAVSVLTTENLLLDESDNLTDSLHYVPNLISVNNVGLSSAATIFLRGVGTTESIVTLEPGISIYLDDVYIARQGVNNLTLNSIDNIEILRGPQGSLYGRNASAGAIKLRSIMPSSQEQTEIELKYGSWDYRSIYLSRNQPLTDNIDSRFSIVHQSDEGFARNLVLNKDVNGTKSISAKGAVAYRISEQFRVDVHSDYTRSSTNGIYGFNILDSGSSNWDTVNSSTDTDNFGKHLGLTIKTSWNPAGNTILKTTNAIRESEQSWNLDLSDQPVSLFTLFTTSDSRQLSQETQFKTTSFNEKVAYIVGTYLFSEHSVSYIGDRIGIKKENSTHLLPLLSRDYDVFVRSGALYGQSEISLSDNIRLLLGGRYTIDLKRFLITQFNGGTPQSYRIDGTIGFDSSLLYANGIPPKYRSTEFTPSFGISYSNENGYSIYATYSEGFRSGGLAARTNSAQEIRKVKNEEVESIEFGLKVSRLNGRINLNTALFHYDYKNLFVSGLDSNGTFQAFNQDAKISGFETELKFRIRDNLHWLIAAGFQESKYVGSTSVHGLLGSELERFPNWKILAEMDSRFSFDFFDINPEIVLKTSDDYFTDISNTELGRSKNNIELDVSITLKPHIYDWEIKLFCSNCLDNRFISNSLNLSGLGAFTIYPNRPQSWAISFRHRF